MRAWLTFLVTAALMAVSMSAAAQATLHDAGAFVGLLDMIRTSANGWSAILRNYATSLFWLLATIQLVLTFGQLLIKQADLSELLAELVRYVLITGFFASLLMYSTVWAEAIINSFRQAGASAAGMSVQLHPGDMFGLAVELAETVAGVEMWNPLTAMIVAISAIIVLLCFTFIAAFMAITLAESYVVINASVLFMAFGGLQWTREYAIAVLRWALSVGAKLFVLTLIVGIIMVSARQWQVAYRHDQASTFALLAIALFCAVMVKTIPEYIQGLIQGVSPGGGSVVGGMAAAAAAGGVAGAAYVASKMGASKLLSGGSGGIASSISSSLFGGGGSSGGGAAPSMMKSSSGGGSASSTGTSWRLGGGANPGSSAPSTPPSSPSGQGGSGSKVGGMAHAAAAGTVRTAGVIASMAVPGMEGAESLSVGPPPTPPETEIPEGMQSTPENIIRPDPVAQAESPAVDTMSSLKEALNNRGMRT